MAQDIVHAGAQRARVNVQALQDLWHDAVGLLQQGEQDMLGIDLGMAVPAQDFVGAGGGVLSAFGEAIESDHGMSSVGELTGALRKPILLSAENRA